MQLHAHSGATPPPVNIDYDKKRILAIVSAFPHLIAGIYADEREKPGFRITVSLEYRLLITGTNDYQPLKSSIDNRK